MPAGLYIFHGGSCGVDAGRQWPMPVIVTIASTTALSIAASAATPAAPLISCHLRSRTFIGLPPDLAGARTAIAPRAGCRRQP
ncbi:conserved hypothetical protein [Burkholderia cenocepacia HI2424]|uniref:Uncharacterized protein n=1 Tax=Burkholderia orbicola (strain AU 1054) TaxID=331271 RepID=A0A0H2XXA5_BURO1|nr:conserved hypothetical protein [Burkholderia cenocepacia HI2424]